ncbi:MAG TPA: serine hydrolase [Gemmatimonadaceae bacterium]
MRTVRVLPLALLLLPACAAGQAPAAGAAVPAHPRADTVSLRRTLDSLADAHHGVVGYTVHNIDTGERLERRGDEPFPTASLIKVPILVTTFALVDSGRLSLDDRIHVLKADKVPGSGVLQFFHDGIDITVGDAAWFMITVSDNTATNLLLDKVGIRTVWATMERLGLPRSKVHSKSFLRSTSVAMDSSVKYGLGVTTPNEMARLFELLARGEAVSPAADSAMLEILEHNEDYQMLYRHAGGVRAARKTGATDSVRTECGLFHLSGRVVACVLTKENADTRWVLDNEPQVTMARMGEAIVRAWAVPEAAR